MNLKITKNQKGLSLVEVIIATSIIVIFLTALIGAYSLYLNLSLSNLQKVRATFLAVEGIEAVKILRDTEWSSQIGPIVSGTDHYIDFTGGTWVATTSALMIDNFFERVFVLSDVNRDASSDITESGGTLDPNTKKVTVTVSWNDKGATSTKVISTFITNLFQN